MIAKRDFLTLEDIGARGILAVLDRADEMKRQRAAGERGSRPLEGKSVALIFEKASTRTRVSFEVGIFELGGHAVVLNAKDTQMGRGEPIQDTARVLSRYVHAIVLRTFSDALMQSLAQHATVPVVNALTDGGHPCQILADLQTVRERLGRLDGLTYAWVGDGNNVANSWIEAANLLGLTLRVATPPGYEASQKATHSKVSFGHSPTEAVRGADVVITDVWASMGQEGEAETRKAAFVPFAVNAPLMAHASANAIVLHCLPAHRGEEIAAEYLDSPSSAVWDEAENRLHSQKALLEYLVR